MRRVGLIGFGSIAENAHLPAWHSFPGVQVTAIADTSRQRLARAQTLLPQACLYDSPLELIAGAEIDCLDIASPPSTHAHFMEAACSRGIGAIICEKPFVLSTDEFLRVVRASDRSGTRVASVNNWLYSDLNQTVKSILAAGEIGEVRNVQLKTGRLEAARGNGGWLPDWRTDLEHSGGGILLDHGWHQLYLLLGWMGQPIERVSAVSRTVNPRHEPVEDEATIQLQFPHGQGQIELSWAAPERINEGQIKGNEGCIDIHDDHVVICTPQNRREIQLAQRLTQSSYHPDWFVSTFRYNVLAADGEEAERNFAEAGLLVSAIGAAYESARHGGAPRVPAVLDDGTDPGDVGGGGSTPRA